jgi:putative ABC transport system permease protein
VIGVVRDFHHQPLIFDVAPLVMAIRPSWYFDLLVKIDAETMPKSLAFIEDTFKTYAPEFPFQASFLDDFFSTIYQPLTIINGIFDGFVGLAIFISCLGLFGLSALLLEQRKKEIGIRKVLGATTHGVVIMLSKRFFRILLISNLIAIPLAYFAVRFFLGFFIRRTELPLSLFVLSGILSFAAAGVTISWQVIKTAHMNPAAVIRNE